MSHASLHHRQVSSPTHALPTPDQFDYFDLIRAFGEVSITTCKGDEWALRIVHCLAGDLTQDNIRRAHSIAQRLIDDGILIRRRSKGLKQCLIQRSGRQGYAHHMCTFYPHGFYRFQPPF